MHRQWTNLIIKASAFASRQKMEMLKKSGLGLLVSLIKVIFAEIWLNLISFPFYFITKDLKRSKKGTKAGYKFRRVMSLTLVLGLFSLWALKTMTIFVGQVYLKNQPVYIVTDLSSQVAEKTLDDIVSDDINKASISSDLNTPIIEEVGRKQNGRIFVSGKGIPNEVINVYAVRADLPDSGVNLFTSDIAADGSWEIIEDKGSYRLATGKYNVSAANYVKELNQRSPISAETQFLAINNTVFQNLFSNTDAIINLLVLFFVVFGTLFTILVI